MEIPGPRGCPSSDTERTVPMRVRLMYVWLALALVGLILGADTGLAGDGPPWP